MSASEQEVVAPIEVTVKSLPIRIMTRLVAALMFGVATVLFVGVTSFLVAQPTSVLRLGWFLPQQVAKFAWVGAAAAAAAFLLLLRAPKSHVGQASVALVAAFGYWWAVQLPIISGWLLPPVQGK
jgi:Ni,Fe-hydrogenase I cytochrome b subunit